MFILWDPEKGVCSECEDDSCEVRGYSDGKTFRLFCFKCWTEAQEEEIVSLSGWFEPVTVIFKSEDNHNLHGNSQKSVSN